MIQLFTTMVDVPELIRTTLVGLRRLWTLHFGDLHRALSREMGLAMGHAVVIVVTALARLDMWAAGYDAYCEVRGSISRVCCPVANAQTPTHILHFHPRSSSYLPATLLVVIYPMTNSLLW